MYLHLLFLQISLCIVDGSNAAGKVLDNKKVQWISKLIAKDIDVKY